MIRKPVLTIFYQFNPWQSSIGGIQSVICSFIKYAPDNFQIRLVGTGGADSTIGEWSEKEYAGTSVLFMPVIRIEDDDVRRLIPTSVKYTQALLGKKLSSDFLHFHRIEPTLSTLKWQGNKTLFIHNDIQQQISAVSNKKAILWKYFPWAYYAFENIVIKQFSNIFVCNTKALKFYRQKYPDLANNINYLKNAVDDQIFFPPTPAEKQEQRREYALKKNLSADTQFVLFAGRLHPQKDPVLLVRSFAALNNPKYHLLIAGVGELAGEVEAEINSLELSDRITMLGAVERQKLAKLYRLSSAFILTSVYEGLPISVLEALASGTPVITTKAGETPNFLTSNSGVVTRNRSIEAIAQSLQQVLSNPQDFPIDACVEIAQPYAAKSIIKDVYNQMWQQWEASNSNFVSMS